ncbi:putative Eukaryotic membrane protein family [Trypanosoma vivax]|uniref:Uncharacterized protein n=1 Tax=Trypanosoma vivax (strain Y486) TaxID=1055687 RepID=G0U0B4_TRYVY|nr:hypothetical protein TRVL_00853 [Trypanosoma vivax]KAH8613614.1 putative Eukaryotic membrane protein family [Trypanosoma vivax]CCC49512.1 conserved hypothetical protein [Trypanosoma vivax Y486]
MRRALLRSLFGTTKHERTKGVTDDAYSSVPSTHDSSFAWQLRYFMLMPIMLADLEFFFALTILGLLENLLSLLLLPLKLVFAFQRFERRDGVALVLIIVGMLTYYSISLQTTQPYAYLYHFVRRTSFIKLMMIFSILEVADKLLSVLLHGAMEVLTACVQDWEHTRQLCTRRGDVFSNLWLPLGSAAVCLLCVSAHSIVLLLSVVTLNVAVNTEGNLLLTFIVSSSLSELKGIAYKKQNCESLYQVAAADAIERVKFLLFSAVMVLQHMHERNHGLDIADTLLVLLAEIVVDFTKHLFVAKFNRISLSVYRSFYQLTLIDMASETVLWRLTDVCVRCIDDLRHLGSELKGLLKPSSSFLPKYVRRTGFVPVPYAALILWSLAPLACPLLKSDLRLLTLALIMMVLLKLAMSELIHGAASRFVVRSMLVPDTQNSRYETGAPTLYGVSPLATPAVSPLRGSPKQSEGGSFLTLQLTSFLCSLIKIEPFDLQTGKGG